MSNTLNWFEIPTVDLARATRFYETTLGTSLRREDFDGMSMAIFAAPEPSVGGALVKDARRKPSDGGALVYLNANGKLDAVLSRVPSAGGEVILPKKDIGAPGFIALVRDSEGNLVGLHSTR
jgi:predicted enzyme related to lactoylglutathione lyase